MELRVTVNGAESVVQFIGDKQARLRDDTPAMTAITSIMRRSADLNFEAQGRPERWDDLLPATLKRRKGGKGLILRDTGYLMQSITQADSQYGIGVTGNHRAEVGTTRPGADVHQNGGSRTVTKKVRVKLPATGRKKGVRRTPEYTTEQRTVHTVARPFLIHQEQDVDDYRQTFVDWLDGAGPFGELR